MVLHEQSLFVQHEFYNYFLIGTDQIYLEEKINENVTCKIFIFNTYNTCLNGCKGVVTFFF